MLKNYLLTTLRNFYREKIYALINIVGLALALSCSLILALYIRSELTYDQHFSGYKRITRVAGIYKVNDNITPVAATSWVLAGIMNSEYPQIGEFVRFQPLGRIMLRSGSKAYYWDDVLIADDNVFKVFSHKAVFGELESALADPSSIAISESFSKQYFGDRNPVGETVSTDTSQYRVSAVFKDLPDNTHFKYSALISRQRLRSFGQGDDNAKVEELFDTNVFTYLKLADGIDYAYVERLLNEFYEKFAADIGKKFNVSIRYVVQPMHKIHFDHRWRGDKPTGNLFYTYGLGAVAVFILLIACINYTNLATARAAQRAKEVGMRKVLGAGKRQLIAQFLGESFLYTLIALVLALVMAEIAEAFTDINSLLNKRDLLNLSVEPQLLVWLLLFSVVIALAAGFYPAFYLSAISPISAISSTKRSKRTGFSLRQSLIFIQFFVSIGVVACTILMSLQMHYVASKPLGFARENHLSTLIRSVDVIEKMPALRSELLRNPNVLGVAKTTFVPGSEISLRVSTVEKNDGDMENNTVSFITVEPGFIDVMGMKIVQGRNFSSRLLTDTEDSVIVNESMVRKMGWHNPLGKRIEWEGWKGRVIGVVKDFHYVSLHQPVQALVMQLYNEDFASVPSNMRTLQTRRLVINISGNDVRETMRYIEGVMTKFDTRHPFEFEFFDDSLNKMYISETNLMKLTAIFSGVCIFICCMGLFGLSALTTEQRTKEIGVRKVLGASTTQIILMLSRYQLILVVVAAVIASVVSYAVMSEWLSGFAYKAPIALWVFVASAAIVGLVAFLTIALQSSKTAQSNPINALRYE